MSMQINKSLGNDRLTRVFCKCLGIYNLKKKKSCRVVKPKQELSTLQRQTVIKLIEKKDTDLLKTGDQFLH